jgi:hypothetical protein
MYLSGQGLKVSREWAFVRKIGIACGAGGIVHRAVVWDKMYVMFLLGL